MEQLCRQPITQVNSTVHKALLKEHSMQTNIFYLKLGYAITWKGEKSIISKCTTLLLFPPLCPPLPPDNQASFHIVTECLPYIVLINITFLQSYLPLFIRIQMRLELASYHTLWSLCLTSCLFRSLCQWEGRPWFHGRAFGQRL